jgi:hypothetical protein
MRMLAVLARSLACLAMLTAVVVMTQSDTGPFVYGGF